MFGQDDEDEADKDVEAKAKAAYRPQMFVQASSSNESTSSSPTNNKTNLTIPGMEPEPTPYVRDAKARRKKEMDAFLEELKRFEKMTPIFYRLVSNR